MYWKNRPEYNYGLKGGERELKRLERFMQNHIGQWQYAIVIDPRLPNGEGVIHYYLESQGTARLSKERYNQLLAKQEIPIYIVYTQEEKRRKGSDNGLAAKVNSLDEVASRYEPGKVDHILVYDQNRVMTHIYNGKKLLPRLTKSQ
jgi:hypothetical protein